MDRAHAARYVKDVNVEATRMETEATLMSRK
jgi:hypothetical protein